MDPTYQRVAALDDIPTDHGLRVVIGDLAIGLYRVDGEIFAMEDVCPHAGASLCGGELMGAVVYCPDHHWDFDVRSGFKPDDADGFPVPCFPVAIEDGDVYVKPEEIRRR